MRMPAAAPAATMRQAGQAERLGAKETLGAQGCRAHLWSLCRSVLLYTDSSSSCQAAPAAGGVAGP